MTKQNTQYTAFDLLEVAARLSDAAYMDYTKIEGYLRETTGMHVTLLAHKPLNSDNREILVYVKELDKTVVAVRGTEISIASNRQDDIAIFFGGDYNKMSAVQSAKAFYTECISNIIPKAQREGRISNTSSMVVTGHSLGAFTAIIVGAAQEVSKYKPMVFAFDSPGYTSSASSTFNLRIN